MCNYAKNPVRKEILKKLGFESLTVGAVCVYPNRVKDVCQMMKKLDCHTVEIASVAAGFPEVREECEIINVLSFLWYSGGGDKRGQKGTKYS